MSEASSTVDSRDVLLAPYFEALQGGEDRADVRARLAAAHPDPGLLAEFDELAAMLGQLGGVAAPAAVAKLPGGPEELPPLPDFRIVREVGRGGMGVVYEAEQLSLQRRVALKVNAGDLSSVQQLRFLREQRVLAQLHQTHIVPIHTAGRVDHWQYFAMAYIEGAALHHVVRSTRQRDTSRPDGRTPPLGDLASAVVQEREDKSTIPAPDLTPSADASPGAIPAAPVAIPVAGHVLNLSLAYFRSAARLLAEAADALQHAHEAGIFHRDVKPSNIMVDAQGECWIIDFGLAGIRPGGEGSTHQPHPPGLEPFTAASRIMGTAQYMAPEQYDGRADARSDIWGLGCTLYELLTLRPAFDERSRKGIERQVRQGEPVPIESLVRGVPKDLAAICRKALQKEPASRYQTAADFAGDLRRWMNDEPTVARPVWMPQRAWLWAKRNRWRAAALVLCTTAVLLGVLAVFLKFRGDAMTAENKEKDAELEKKNAQVRFQAADLLAKATEVRFQAAKHDLQMGQLQRRAQFGSPFGWSQEWLELVRDYYKDRPEPAKRKGRDEAAATLAGLDAVPEKELKQDAGALAFSPDSKRLVLGGLPPFAGAKRVTGGVYDRDTDRMTPSEAPDAVGEGPVAFTADGRPLQLAATGPYTLRLWDVDRQRKAGEFTFAPKLPPAPPGAGNPPAMALSADGTLLAASTRLPDGKDVLVVWDAGTGREVARAAAKAEVLAFSPDKALLATAGGSGTVIVRPVSQFDKETILPGDRLSVHCMAFTRDPVRRQKDGREASGWLLAAGQAGGDITIWDVERKVPRMHCLGSHHDVYGVAFSPDGTLLASVGRGAPRLWDVTTGQLLLTLEMRNTLTDVAFSPDGRSLAVSAVTMHGTPGYVKVYALEHGRGIQTLRGLRGQVEHVCMSPDQHYVAALTQDWQVAVWDLKAGQLLHVFEAPTGPFADSAALAFSADGELACASWNAAVRWDVAKGRELGRWDFPPGLVNQLAFRAPGKLLLFRVETEDMRHPPAGGAHPKDHPRVCRIRDLLAKDPKKPLAELRDLNWHVRGGACPADGSYFVADGIHSPGGEREAQLIVYEGLTGKPLWVQKYKMSPSGGGAGPRLDPTGKLLAYIHYDNPDEPGGGSRTLLAEMPAGTARGSIPPPVALGPGAEWWATPAPGDASTQSFGIQVHRREDTNPLVTLGTNTLATGDVLFSANGTHIAWGNADGTVTVCDIQEVRRRLAAVGLGW